MNIVIRSILEEVSYTPTNKTKALIQFPDKNSIEMYLHKHTDNVKLAGNTGSVARYYSYSDMDNYISINTDNIVYTDSVATEKIKIHIFEFTSNPSGDAHGVIAEELYKKALDYTIKITCVEETIGTVYNLAINGFGEVMNNHLHNNKKIFGSTAPIQENVKIKFKDTITKGDFNISAGIHNLKDVKLAKFDLGKDVRFKIGTQEELEKPNLIYDMWKLYQIDLDLDYSSFDVEELFFEEGYYKHLQGGNTSYYFKGNPAKFTFNEAKKLIPQAKLTITNYNELPQDLKEFFSKIKVGKFDIYKDISNTDSQISPYYSFKAWKESHIDGGLITEGSLEGQDFVFKASTTDNTRMPQFTIHSLYGNNEAQNIWKIKMNDVYQIRDAVQNSLGDFIRATLTIKNKDFQMIKDSLNVTLNYPNNGVGSILVRTSITGTSVDKPFYNIKNLGIRYSTTYEGDLSNKIEFTQQEIQSVTNGNYTKTINIPNIKKVQAFVVIETPNIQGEKEIASRIYGEVS